MATIEEALTPVSKMPAAEGYQLAVSGPAGTSAHLTVTAGPEACEYCLVPKSVLQAIVVKNLSENGLSVDVTLAYPGEPSAS
jgi:hypothetical protein